jgi:hypothetical protein
MALALSRKYVECIISNGLGVSAYLALTTARAFREATTLKNVHGFDEYDPLIEFILKQLRYEKVNPAQSGDFGLVTVVIRFAILY